MLASLIVEEVKRVADELGHEDPYAFAIIQGQQCNYLGYAIATDQALARTCQSYLGKGYRYRGTLALSDVEALGYWLKWSNPDDGWHYFDFPDQVAIQEFLQRCERDNEALRSACIKELKKASMDTATSYITLGLSYGQDPEDFRRSVIDIYGERSHNTFIVEFALMKRLAADIQRE